MGGREAEQVMDALTQSRCDIFQQAANLQLQSGSSATGDPPCPVYLQEMWQADGIGFKMVLFVKL